MVEKEKGKGLGIFVMAKRKGQNTKLFPLEKGLCTNRISKKITVHPKRVDVSRSHKKARFHLLRLVPGL